MTTVRVGGGAGLIEGGTLRIVGTYAGTFNPASGLPTIGTGKNGAILRGDYWNASGAGTIVGLSPFTVFAANDIIFATINNATTVNDFFGNKGTGSSGSGDVVGPSSAIDSRMVEFNGTSGKLIKDGGVVVSVFIKTLLDDADAVTARTTLGAQASLGFTPPRRSLLNYTTTQSVTGTTSETKLISIQVPANTIQVGDVLNIRGFFTKSGTAGSGTHRVSTNTTDDLTGSPIRLGLVNNGGGTGVHSVRIAREFPVKATNNMSGAVSGTANAPNDITAVGSAVSTFATDWTVTQYIIFSSQLSNAGDTATLQSVYVEIIR